MTNSKILSATGLLVIGFAPPAMSQQISGESFIDLHSGN
jgi:hypothetical protein